MGGFEFGNIASKDESALDALIQRAARMLREGELPAQTDVLLLHDIKRRKWLWNTTITLVSRKSNDRWFQFPLLNSDGSRTHKWAYISDKVMIGIPECYDLVSRYDHLGKDHTVWLHSLQVAIDSWAAKGTVIMSHKAT